VTSIISSAVWIKLQKAAAKQFPGETLARGEVLRRFSLAGVSALKDMSETDSKRLQHQY
jgi:hypothetical protein